MSPGLLRAVLIVSGLAVLAGFALTLGLSGGDPALTAGGAALAGLAVVALARLARFVLITGRGER